MNGPLPPLSDSGIVAAARAAGFAGESLVTMVATILAESGGDPDNVGDENLVTSKWGPSIGLAQIRSLIADRGTGRSRDATRLTDPGFNLRSAWQISSGGSSFSAWTAYNSGAYRKYVDRARAAVAGTPVGAPVPGSVRAIAGGIPVIGDWVANLVKGLERISLLGVMVAGGVALVAAGAWRATSSARAAAKNAAEDAMATGAVLA